MKKFIALCAVVVSLMAFSVMASAATRTVSIVGQRDGSTPNSLRQALRDCNEGDVIILTPGEYQLEAPLELNGKKNITIKSSTGNYYDVIIKGTSFHKIDSQRSSDVPGRDYPDYRNSGDEEKTPHGIINAGDELLFINSSSDITISGITFTLASSQGIKLATDSGVKNVTIQNCRFFDINERMIKGVNGGGKYLENIKIINNHFENAQVPNVGDIKWGEHDGDYVAGIDIMFADGLLISGNTFKNIKGTTGSGRAGIFIWVGSKNVIAENNTFINCDRGISYGVPGTSSVGQNMKNGLIRNNLFIGGSSSNGSGISIEIAGGEDIKIYNNTVYRPQGRGGIVLQDTGNNRNIDIKNNFIFGNTSLGGSTVTQSNNKMISRSGTFPSANFVDASNNDFHLTKTAADLIGMGVTLPEVTKDFDGTTRLNPPSIGAFEFVPPADKISGKVLFKTNPLLPILPTVTITDPEGNTRPIPVAADGSFGDIAILSGVEYTIKAEKARHLPLTMKKTFTESETFDIPMICGNVLDDPNSEKFIIDIDDLIALLGSYKASAGSAKYNVNADFDESGIVDIDDLIILLGSYKKSAPRV